MAAKKLNKKFTGKQLTDHLERLACDTHTWTEDKGAISKGQALADLLFKKALGWTEEKIDDEGKSAVVEHKPESWAIQMIWERLEGKSPQGIQDQKDGLTAKDRVGELAKQRLNRVAVGDKKPSGPPSYKPRKDKDAK